MTTIETTADPPRPREIDVTRTVAALGNLVKRGRQAASAKAQSARGKFRPAPPTTPPASFSTLAPYGFRSKAVEYAQFDAENLVDEAKATVRLNRRSYDTSTWMFILANVPRQVLFFLALLPMPPSWDEHNVWSSILAWLGFLAVIVVFIIIPLGVDRLLRAAIRQVGTSTISWAQRGPTLIVMLVLVGVSGILSYNTPLPGGLQKYAWLMTLPSACIALAQILKALCQPSHKIIRQKESEAYRDAGLAEPTPPPPPAALVLPPPPPAPKTRNTEQEKINRDNAVAKARENPALKPGTLAKATGVCQGTAKKVLEQVQAEIEAERAAAEQAKAAKIKADQLQARRDRAAARRHEKEKQADQIAPDKEETAPEPPPAEPAKPKPVKAVRPRAPRARRSPEPPGSEPLPLPKTRGEKDIDALDTAAKLSGPTRRKRPVNGKVPADV